MDTRCNYIINSYLQPVCPVSLRVFLQTVRFIVSFTQHTHTRGGAVISNEWSVIV